MKSLLKNWVKTGWYKRIKAVPDKSFYRILGMRRSGNHALMNWLIGQMNGQVAVLDNMQRLEPSHTPHKKMILNKGKGTSLIVSHEDRPLDDFFLEYDAAQFGTSAKKFNLLLLRDPYNWLASWYAWPDHLGADFREKKDFRSHTIELWKDYARKFLEWEQMQEPENDVWQMPVSYNRWCIDLTYRKELAVKLGLEFTDKGREKVSINGYGSSFDGQEYNGRASDLKVLERWKNFAEDPFYRSLIDDEIRELSGSIFPELKVDF